MATRYDKLAANYLAFIQLASIRVWLRANESSPVIVAKLYNEWNRQKLRNWMVNAKRLGFDDAYRAAMRQL